jgi:hypothetical protein
MAQLNNITHFINYQTIENQSVNTTLLVVTAHLHLPSIIVVLTNELFILHVY